MYDFDSRVPAEGPQPCWASLGGGGADSALLSDFLSSLDGRSTGENFRLGLIVTDEDTGATKLKEGTSADENAAYGVHPACQGTREVQGLGRGRDAKIYRLVGGCNRGAKMAIKVPVSCADCEVFCW